MTDETTHNPTRHSRHPFKPYQDQVRERVNTLRSRWKFTITDLAAYAGVHRGMTSMFVNGKWDRNVRAVTLDAWREAAEDLAWEAAKEAKARGEEVDMNQARPQPRGPQHQTKETSHDTETTDGPARP